MTKKEECDVCGKKFFRAFSLKKHAIVHNEQLREERKIFKCEWCEKRFDTPRNLANHTVVTYVTVHSKEM